MGRLEGWSEDVKSARDVDQREKERDDELPFPELPDAFGDDIAFATSIFALLLLRLFPLLLSAPTAFLHAHLTHN